MTIDCDALRNHEEDGAEPIAALAATNDARASAQTDADDGAEAAEEFELPGTDLE